METSEPDTEKHYMCYFCEEEIEFSLSCIADDRSKPNWRHTATGKEVCETRATPSNLEVLPTFVGLKSVD